MTIWESVELQGISRYAAPGLCDTVGATTPLPKPLISWGNPLEASEGIEPPCKDLQEAGRTSELETEVRIGAWIDDGKLRHASYKILRNDGAPPSAPEGQMTSDNPAATGGMFRQ